MRTVNLKLVGVNSKVNPKILVDGQYVKYKKNEFGSCEATVQTEKDEIEIAFSRDLELRGKLWWLYALISFLVSVFGIFEPPYDRKCISMECLYKIKLNDTNEIKIMFNSLTSSGRAVEIETQNEFEEIKNEYLVDKTAKRRRKVLLFIKIFVWIGTAILLGYFLSKGF